MRGPPHPRQHCLLPIHEKYQRARSKNQTRSPVIHPFNILLLFLFVLSIVGNFIVRNLSWRVNYWQVQFKWTHFWWKIIKHTYIQLWCDSVAYICAIASYIATIMLNGWGQKAREEAHHPTSRSKVVALLPVEQPPPPHRLPKLSNLRCYYSFQCSQCLFNLKFIHDCCCRQPSIPPILKMLKKEDLWIFETAMTSPIYNSKYNCIGPCVCICNCTCICFVFV